MNIPRTLLLILPACLLAGCATLDTPQPIKEHPMIVHSVFFRLNHAPGSDAEAAFLAKAAKLAKIPGVGNFQTVEETSPKNPFTFGLSMEFADQTAYDNYNTHPDHVRFVKEVWLEEVAEFQEIDHIPYSNHP
jgi:quinol monooxygenase YgiN